MRNVSMIVLAGVLALATPLVASAQRVPPTNNNYPTPSVSSEEACEYGMGHLKAVSARQIRGVDDSWRVWVRPICEDSPHAPVRNLGNATQLIGAIGRNDTLETALGDERYLADDVVGVQLTKGNRVTLWVHRSLY
ncbi:MAG: hypothetical protein EOP19_01425 [Hyphomicrobiales bacterium]|nr:MAG: hypothetical protein EOP19_01425 [Hyphomicrobiales bacterium]